MMVSCLQAEHVSRSTGAGRLSRVPVTLISSRRLIWQSPIDLFRLAGPLSSAVTSLDQPCGGQSSFQAAVRIGRFTEESRPSAASGGLPASGVRGAQVVAGFATSLTTCVSAPVSMLYT